MATQESRAEHEAVFTCAAKPDPVLRIASLGSAEYRVALVLVATSAPVLADQEGT